MTIAFPAALSLFLASGLGYVFWQGQRTSHRRRAERQALAASRGLDYAVRARRGGTPVETHFIDRRRGLTLTVTHPGSHRRGRLTTRAPDSTCLAFTRPALTRGMVIYLPEPARHRPTAADRLMGLLDNRFARMLIGRFLGNVYAPWMAELRPQPVPPGLPLRVMASSDPAPLFDIEAVARAMAAAPTGSKGDARAMVVITDAGLQIRLTRALLEAREIADLLDTGLALHAGILR